MTSNSYVETSIQKGGIPGFSGCVEHTSVISQLIKEAKETKGGLTCVWLDLANSYGSVAHELIKTAMSLYHIPAHVVNIINNYFGGIKLRFTYNDITTKWQNLERGSWRDVPSHQSCSWCQWTWSSKQPKGKLEDPRCSWGSLYPRTEGLWMTCL